MNTDKKQRTLKDYIKISGIGVAMGAADVVPGVSGGTMAFILGIYEELLTTIKSVNIKCLKLLFSGKFAELAHHINLKFIIALGAGLGAALISLSHAISWCLSNEPVALFAFFFGLIVASIISVSTHVKWNPLMILTCGIGAATAYIGVRVVPMDMPNDPFTLFWCSSIAIIAMILPGISGSFLLFILGQYRFIIEAVKSLDVIALIPVAAGAAIGIMIFSRVLTWLLKKYHQPTITLLIGFMIGSLWKIWPFRRVLETAEKSNGKIIPIKEAIFFPDLSTDRLWISVILCILGFVIISVLDHLQSGSNPFVRMFQKKK